MFPKSARSLRLVSHIFRNAKPSQQYISSIKVIGENNSSNLSPSCFRYFHQTASPCAITPVKMPSLSPTMTEGTIVKWLKQEGDRIAPGDVLCEIQTDKAVVSLEYDEEGVLAKVLKGENSTDIKVGIPIALIVDEGEDWKNVEIPKDLETSSTAGHQAATASTPPTPSHTGLKPSSTATEETHASGKRIGPAVRNLLIQYGLSATQVPATGAHGTLLKGDILRQVMEQKIQPKSAEIVPTLTTKPQPVQTSSPFIDLEITSMRKTIAKRLLQSKSSIAHAYATAECRINGITSLRKRIQNAGLKVSVNDFIIKCTANALGKVPDVNVVWDGGQLKRMGQIDISVAVATDSGLITPIVMDVAGKDILQISENVGALAAKARSGKLQPQEFMGGTFTISNLGMFGVHHFSAIINPPQCAILAVGGGHSYIGENGSLENRINLTLSYDAAGISEETALKFLAHLKHELENSSETSMGIYNIESRLEIQELLQTQV